MIEYGYMDDMILVQAHVLCANCGYQWDVKPENGKTTLGNCPKCAHDAIIIQNLKRYEPPKSSETVADSKPVDDVEAAGVLLRTLAGCFESDAMDTRLVGPAKLHIIAAFHAIRMDAAARAIKFTIRDGPAPSTFLDELEKHRAAVLAISKGDHMVRTPTEKRVRDLTDAVWFLLSVAHQP